jgi:hypothetical protein
LATNALTASLQGLLGTCRLLKGDELLGKLASGMKEEEAVVLSVVRVKLVAQGECSMPWIQFAE